MFRVKFESKKKSSLKNKRDLELFNSEALKAVTIKSGFPAEKVKKSIVERAVFNEFGTRNIPARPFVRVASNKFKDKYSRMFAAIAKKSLRGKKLSSEMEKIGREQVKDIQRTILSLRTPPLAAETIRRKKSRKLLIDTKQMFFSASYVLTQGRKGKPKR